MSEKNICRVFESLESLRAALSGGFGVPAALLTVVGLYGFIAPTRQLSARWPAQSRTSRGWHSGSRLGTKASQAVPQDRERS
jgi:hypothetical protein